MTLRDYIETTTAPLLTTVEIIDNAGTTIGYVKKYTYTSMEMLFKRIKRHLDNEIKEVIIIPKENYIEINIYLIQKRGLISSFLFRIVIVYIANYLLISEHSYQLKFLTFLRHYVNNL